MKRIYLLFFLFVVLFCFFIRYQAIKISQEKREGDYVIAKYKNISLNLKTAISQEARAQGLMNISKPLEDNEGMLFIYKSEEFQTFWMKNTYIPLDIIFLDEDFKVINFFENTKVNQTKELYSSEKPSQYVIEMNAGWANENHLKINDEFKINL